MTTKDYALGAVLSATTGILVSSFADLQELFDHVCGGPVWTHEMPGLFAPVREELIRQYPSLPIEAPPLNSAEECRAWVAEEAATFGATLPIEGGMGPQRTQDPITTLIDKVGADKVIVIGMDDEGKD